MQILIYIYMYICVLIVYIYITQVWTCTSAAVPHSIQSMAGYFAEAPIIIPIGLLTNAICRHFNGNW